MVFSKNQQTMNYDRFDDETLLRLIDRSHEPALSTLYDRYSRLVYSVALKSTGDPTQAEEITQDVFVRVWEKAGTYRVDLGHVAIWLTSIARNRAIDLFRRSKTRAEHQSITWESVESFTSSEFQEVEGEVDLLHRQQKVRWAIAQLPEEQKQVLTLAYFQGFSHSELAQVLDIPLGTAKTRLRLAMQKLRQLLQANGLE